MKKNKTKRLLVFSYEGKNNQTEKPYFNHFKCPNKEFVIKSFSMGYTDLKNLVKHSEMRAKQEYGFDKNDILVVFKDVDCNIKVIDEIKTLKPKNNIIIIFSNPSFETWFLNHFKYTTKKYCNQDEIIIDLKKYISKYYKGFDAFDLLNTKTKNAILNSKKQFNYINSEDTYTMVFRVFDEFRLTEK